MFRFIGKIFKRKRKCVDFPKDTSWMLKSDFSPNIKNLKRCKEFQALMDVKQNPQYHKEGDVWKHTLKVAKEMHKIINGITWGISDKDKKILMVAAICHDIGKATTTYFDTKENAWKCKNHGLEGERMTRNLLYNETIEEREEICWLVRWHMTFHHLLEKPIDKQTEIIRTLSKGYSTLEKLLFLNLADSRGSVSEENTEEKINERFQQICKITIDEDCYIKPFKEKNDTPKHPIMYVMIGLPGSGKDTYIKRFLNPDYPCICRDDIREELVDGVVMGRKFQLKPREENIVTEVVNKNIRECCQKNKNFIINQTSLKRKYRDELISYAKKYADVKVVYIYIEAPSVEECIKRRGGGKWKSIVNQMWNNIDFPDKSECDEMLMIKQKGED